KFDISFRTTGEGGKSETYLNGSNVEREIRTMRISQIVSKVAGLPFVRNYIDGILHRMGASRGVVMDGRDIGTTVFPDAELKLFMTADATVRARRRYDELVSKGESPVFEDVLLNVRERDYLDEHRDVSPLKMATDAILLDNGNMTIEEEVEWIMKKIENLGDENYHR
ncbi:MAG: (d)CMP kinase, partial [Alistipes sp.]|nr:(d)CMP kinase [Candidatus Minthomonas equi]